MENEKIYIPQKCNRNYLLRELSDITNMKEVLSIPAVWTLVEKRLPQYAGRSMSKERICWIVSDCYYTAKEADRIRKDRARRKRRRRAKVSSYSYYSSLMKNSFAPGRGQVRNYVHNTDGMMIC